LTGQPQKRPGEVALEVLKGRTGLSYDHTHWQDFSRLTCFLARRWPFECFVRIEESLAELPSLSQEGTQKGSQKRKKPIVFNRLLSKGLI